MQVEEGEEREGKMVPVGCKPGQIDIYKRQGELGEGRRKERRGGEVS